MLFGKLPWTQVESVDQLEMEMQFFSKIHVPSVGFSKLEKIVAECLERDPKDRPTVEDLIREMNMNQAEIAGETMPNESSGIWPHLGMGIPGQLLVCAVCCLFMYHVPIVFTLTVVALASVISLYTHWKLGISKS